MPRRNPIQAGLIYHVFNRSIAGYKIFHKEEDYQRFVWMMRFYTCSESNSFSNFFRDNKLMMEEKLAKRCADHKSSVQLIAYCLMPTHFHFVVSQKELDAISYFMQKIQNSYAHYFNLRHKRQGPLWSGRFKNVECSTDEQLLHLTRYIHLNPVSDYLTESPKNWFASSYHEYLNPHKNGICCLAAYLQIQPATYEKFVVQRIDEQRALSKIKHLMLD